MYLQQDQKVQEVWSRESRTGSVEQGVKDRNCGAGRQGQEVWSRASRTGSVEQGINVRKCRTGEPQAIGLYTSCM